MKKILVVDADKCTGCMICELICSSREENLYNPRKSLIRVLRNREMNVHVPVLRIKCLAEECEKCARLCPTQALKFVKPAKAALVRKCNRIGKFPVPVIGA